MSALAGVTVLLTRPDEEEDALKDALAGAGANVLHAPMIRFSEADPANLVEALRRPCTAVLLTSPRAVRAAAPHLPAALPVIPLAARTRQEAMRAGLNVLDLRDAADGADLAEAIAAAIPLAGARFVMPASNLAQPTVADALRAWGALVDVVVAYETHPAEAMAGDARAALLAGRVHAVVCMSPSAVRALVALVPQEALRGPARIVPGRTTEAEWRRQGFDAVVAPGPSAAQMVEGLRQALGR